jgi:DNA invertase Pin-like site-specific DNA recombinase
MTTYGYAWVSTDAQTFDAQVAALKAAGAERIFSEKQSGANGSSRPITRPGGAGRGKRAGHSARQAGRSTRDLLNVLATISEREGGFWSLSDQWADTTMGG